jgi:malate dehydrogenase
MIKAIVHDEQKVLPCCAMIDGLYGLSDVCLGVPVQLGGQGVEEIIELDLTADERKKMQEAAREITSAVSMIDA